MVTMPVPDVDADGFLTLGQQAAGQPREGIGYAQAYDGGKGGIDRGGADHVGIGRRWRG